MPEISQVTFKHTEIVELLLKKQGIHEGIWGLFIKFGLGAANVGATEGGELNPAAIIPVLEIGLQKFEKVTNLSVDASIVNPKVAERQEK
jgi:hypothetical protein